MYFLIKGKLELRRFTADGQTLVTHHATAGETFAEASLFSHHYHCDAVARTDCLLIEFDRTILLAAIENDGLFALALTARFSQQIQGFRRRFEILAIKDANERVYVAMSENLLDPGHDIKSFAAGIGLAHETVYRSLNLLVQQNKIVRTGRGRYQLNHARPAAAVWFRLLTFWQQADHRFPNQVFLPVFWPAGFACPISIFAPVF